ncbi:hypothetical protein [Leptolyngbya boryana]
MFVTRERDAAGAEVADRPAIGFVGNPLPFCGSRSSVVMLPIFCDRICWKLEIAISNPVLIFHIVADRPAIGFVGN